MRSVPGKKAYASDVGFRGTSRRTVQRVGRTTLEAAGIGEAIPGTVVVAAETGGSLEEEVVAEAMEIGTIRSRSSGIAVNARRQQATRGRIAQPNGQQQQQANTATHDDNGHEDYYALALTASGGNGHDYKDGGTGTSNMGRGFGVYCSCDQLRTWTQQYPLGEGTSDRCRRQSVGVYWRWSDPSHRADTAWGEL